MNLGQLVGERMVRCDARWIPFEVPMVGMASDLCGCGVRPVCAPFPCGHERSLENSYMVLVNEKYETARCRTCRNAAQARYRDAAREKRAALAERRGIVRGTGDLQRFLRTLALSMPSVGVTAFSDEFIAGRQSVRVVLEQLVQEGLFAREVTQYTRTLGYVYVRAAGVTPPDVVAVGEARAALLARARAGTAKRGL